MSKLAVIYWTGTGNTGAMAQAVADGAKGAGAEAELLTVSEISADAAAAYDKLASGPLRRRPGVRPAPGRTPAPPRRGPR